MSREPAILMQDVSRRSSDRPRPFTTRHLHEHLPESLVSQEEHCRGSSLRASETSKRTEPRERNSLGALFARTPGHAEDRHRNENS